MKWRKVGNIFTPNGDKDWAQSHASVPIADHVSGNIFRIYYTSRDIRNSSHVGWVEIDIEKPNIIQMPANNLSVIYFRSLSECKGSSVSTWITGGCFHSLVLK